MEKSKEPKLFSVKYTFDEKGKVSFINPNCDEMPLSLFAELCKAIGVVETTYNNSKND